MFKYSLKTKLIAGGVFLAVLIAMTIALHSYYGHSKDLVLVSQVQLLGNSLEVYYDKFNAYPTADKIAVDNISYITDQGINQTGDIIYFKNNLDWAGPAVYSSNGQNYKIGFELQNSWPLWGLDSGGGACQLTGNLSLQCGIK